jgi:hypothetical protein
VIKASSINWKTYRWGEVKQKAVVPPTSEYAIAAIDITCKMLESPHGFTLDQYKAPRGVDIQFVNDCAYKDFFGVRFHRNHDFDSDELNRIVYETLCFFNTLGFPMSVIVNYFKAKRKFSDACSLTLNLNFLHCYDNEDSRATFSRLAHSL